MKKIILPLLLLTSFAHADEVNELALVFGGLQKVPSIDQSRIDFRFQDRAIFTFSKEKFTSFQAAQEFCNSKNLPMAKAEHILLLGIASSGLSDEINDAITYSITAPTGEKAGGVIGWHSSPRNSEKEVFVIPNGQGMSGSTESFQAISQFIPGIPAVCTDIDLKEESAGVDDSDRSFSPDEVEQTPARSNAQGSRTSQQ